MRHLESKADQQTRREHNKTADAYMYIFLTKFLVKALRKRAQREFARRKCGRSRVTAQGGSRASEDQRAPLAALIEGLALERGNHLARERECCFDVCIHHMVDFVLRNLQERLPDGEACIEERDADVGVRPMCTHCAESTLDLLIVVIGYWERGCL